MANPAEIQLGDLHGDRQQVNDQKEREGDWQTLLGLKDISKSLLSILFISKGQPVQW